MGAWNQIQDILNRVDPIDVLDVFLIALLIYWGFLLLRGTAAIALLRGAAIVLIATVFLARSLHLVALDFVIRNSLTGLIIAVPIIFQPEIRRALERIGRTGFGVWARPPYEDIIKTISKAATDLAARRLRRAYRLRTRDRSPELRGLRRGSRCAADHRAARGHLLSERTASRRRCDHAREPANRRGLHAAAVRNAAHGRDGPTPSRRPRCYRGHRRSFADDL